MKTYLTSLNIFYSVILALTLLTILDVLPRETSFLILFLYIIYIFFSDITSATSLVIRSIPIFIALPITESFDNFNTWRLIVTLLFLKWGLSQNRFKKALIKMFSLDYKSIDVLKKYSIEISGVIFLILTLISVFPNPNIVDGLFRVIYIVNAVFLFIVVRSIVIDHKQRAVRFCKDIVISALLVLGIGYVQFVVSYFLTAEQFHHFWGSVVSTIQYGQNLGDIVLQANTWFSYNGDTLRLRMFSLFTDSHAFPLYLIISIPAIMVLFFRKSTSEFLLKHKITNYKPIIYTFIYLLGMLALFFSGTRGIWVASIIPLGLVIFLWRKDIRKYAQYILISVFVFVCMFGFYFGIISQQQFLDSRGSTSLSVNRLFSSIDFGETSNKRRIEIWEDSIKGIQENPILGVGAYNFPLVVDEPLSYALMGSSAHNLYLHIAVTTGIISAIIFMAMMFEIIRRGILSVRKYGDSWDNMYLVASSFSLIWACAYLMTDATLFDGRVLLMFMASVGIFIGLYHSKTKINV